METAAELGTIKSFKQLSVPLIFRHWSFPLYSIFPSQHQATHNTDSSPSHVPQDVFFTLMAQILGSILSRLLQQSFSSSVHGNSFGRLKIPSVHLAILSHVGSCSWSLPPLCRWSHRLQPESPFTPYSTYMIRYGADIYCVLSGTPSMIMDGAACRNLSKSSCWRFLILCIVISFIFIFSVVYFYFFCYTISMGATIYGRRLVLHQRDCDPLFT